MNIERVSDEERAAWWIFLTASPVGVVAGTPEALSSGIVGGLPENIRRVLTDDRTAARIFLLAQQLRLTDDQTRDVARLVKNILIGETSAADLEKKLRSISGISGSATAQLAEQLKMELIAPNYFQINQVYEKKHKTTGSRELGVGSREQGVGTTVTPPVPSHTALAPLPRPASPNVVDLRNGAIPHRLPPTPRVVPAPAGAEWGPPRVAPASAGAEWGPPRASTAPVPSAPAFLPSPRPPTPALPAPVKPLAALPAPRIQGTPLDHMTPSHPLVLIPPPRPTSRPPAQPTPPSP